MAAKKKAKAQTLATRRKSAAAKRPTLVAKKKALAQRAIRHTWRLGWVAPVYKLIRLASKWKVVPFEADPNELHAGLLRDWDGPEENVQVTEFTTSHDGKPDPTRIFAESGVLPLDGKFRLVAAKPAEQLSVMDTDVCVDASLDPGTCTPDDYFQATGDYPQTTGKVVIDVTSVTVTAATFEKEANRLLKEGYNFVAIEPEHGEKTTRNVDRMAKDLRDQIKDAWAEHLRQEKKAFGAKSLTNKNQIIIAGLLIDEWRNNIPFELPSPLEAREFPDDLRIAGVPREQPPQDTFALVELAHVVR